jgi:hypothetical protein
LKFFLTVFARHNLNSAVAPASNFPLIVIRTEETADHKTAGLRPVPTAYLHKTKTTSFIYLVNSLRQLATNVGRQTFCPLTKEAFASRKGKQAKPNFTMAGRCPKILMSVLWIILLLFIVWPISFALAALWVFLLVRYYDQDRTLNLKTVFSKYYDAHETVSFLYPAAFRGVLQLHTVH